MKKAAQWAIIIGSILISINLTRSVLDLLNRQEIIDETKQKLIEKREEYNKLTKELAQVQDQSFVEKQARDKLNLAREGEVVVIVPSITPPQKKSEADNRDNWEKWRDAFRL